MEKEPKILIIVGRAEDDFSFIKKIEKELPEGFIIEGVHSLNEYSDVDNKDRFIAFISCEDDELFESKSDEIVRSAKGIGFGSSPFNDVYEAFDYAQTNYGFLPDDEEREKRFEEMRERFPLFTAEEWEQVSIFDSLYHTGKVRPIRARFADEPVIVLAHLTAGSDELRVTPMMILITDDIHSELELPFAN